MKTVRLPIYENGLALKHYLEVDVNLFAPGMAGSKARLVSVTTPEEEIDIVNRIIHDLPPVPKPAVVDYAKQKVELPLSEQWERIPLHNNYEINPLMEIRNFWTKRVLEVVTTPTKVQMVELHDKQGHPYLFSVHNLSAMVYGS